MKIARVFAGSVFLIVTMLLTACSDDGEPRLADGQIPMPGPVSPLSSGLPCNVDSDDSDVYVLWHQPQSSEEATATRQGLQIVAPAFSERPEEIVVEILEKDSCEVSARFQAKIVHEQDGSVGYLVPIEEINSQLQPGTYVSRVVSDFSAFDNAGGMLTVPPVVPFAAFPCSGELVLDEELDVGTLGGDREFQIMRETAGDLCVEIVRKSDFWVVREITVNEQRVHPPSDKFDDRSSYVINYPGRAYNYRLNLDLAKGKARVIAKIKDKSPATGPSRIDCGGRLQGYDDRPYVDNQRRNIKRAGIMIGCTAVYQTGRSWAVNSPGVSVPSIGSGKVETRITSPAWTDAEGRFEASISPGAIQRAGVGSDDELLGVETDCWLDEQCGVDRSGTHVKNPDWAWWLPIRKVPDVAFSGLVARLITKAKFPSPPKFSKDGQTQFAFSQLNPFENNEVNDFPVLFHEPFDSLKEDGTVALAWALGGQPTDYSKPGDASKIRANVCDGEIRGACFQQKNQLFTKDPPAGACTWTESCLSSAQTQSDRFRCEGVNLLSIMVDKGYDVWLIDHVREDPTILELATRSPALYQRIADYPSPEWFGRTNRDLTIVGVSMGGVVARTGIRLWELKDKLDRLGESSELQLVRPDLIRDTAAQRVALYISYEGPHRGTNVPISFQALVKDSTMPSRLNFADVLNTRAAEQLTVPFVEPGVDTECIKGGEPETCTLGVNDVASAYVNEFESTLLRFQAVEVLDALDGQSRVRLLDALPPLSHDGIPTTVPAIAVSNGSLGDGNGTAFGNYAKLHVEAKAFGLDILAPDRNVRLEDNANPHGSALTQICRLHEVNDSGRKYVVGSYKLSAEIFHAPIFVPTKSALSLDYVGFPFAERELPFRWHDALWQRNDSSHFNFDERQCQFLVYHLDGKMRGDKDGYPACREGPASCDTGAKIPGGILADIGFNGTPMLDYCDPDDDDARVFPPAFPTGVIPLPKIPFKVEDAEPRLLP